MKAYTDIEQSKKLAKILPIESADMCYIHDLLAEDYGLREYKPYELYVGNLFTAHGQDKIECWSLAALLEQLEDRIFDEDGNEYELVIKKEGVQYDIYYLNIWGEQENIELDCFNDDLIDCCFQMILKLKEKKLL